MLLLDRRIVECPILADRSSQGKSRTITMEIRGCSLGLKWISRAKSAVLNGHKGITMNRVYAVSRDHIDGAA